jgi:hypothetical protein
VTTVQHRKSVRKVDRHHRRLWSRCDEAGFSIFTPKRRPAIRRDKGCRVITLFPARGAADRQPILGPTLTVKNGQTRPVSGATDAGACAPYAFDWRKRWMISSNIENSASTP